MYMTELKFSFSPLWFSKKTPSHSRSRPLVMDDDLDAAAGLASLASSDFEKSFGPNFLSLGFHRASESPPAEARRETAAEMPGRWRVWVPF